MPEKLCHRCREVNRVARSRVGKGYFKAKPVSLWRCRAGCGNRVCEHFCGNKAPDGWATCTSCKLLREALVRSIVKAG